LDAEGGLESSDFPLNAPKFLPSDLSVFGCVVILIRKMIVYKNRGFPKLSPTMKSFEHCFEIGPKLVELA
jgi:hypothetical protein